MNSKHHWLALAAVIALGAALGTACGGEDTKENDLCASVQCLDPATTCDPTDGICKCGTGDDRIICKSNEICQTEPTPTCVQDLCVGVTCVRGETCDPTDGVCKCGIFSCQEGEICSQNRCVVPDPCKGILCPDGETCDPVDGACKCGGEICGEDERCDDGLCIKDPCKGVHCGGNNVCNPADLACHCGNVTGPVCMTGQACVVDEFGAFTCEGADLCEGVTCEGDAICDPSDGTCRCGGLGADFPICESPKVCFQGECKGGNPCSGVQCLPGFTCDESDGLCKCGGRLCGEDETCMLVTVEGETRYQCVQQCDPFAQPNPCGVNHACYLDINISAVQGYCAPAGSAKVDEDCEVPQDCEPEHTCLGTGGGSCVLLCERDSLAFGDDYCTTQGYPLGCLASSGAKYGFCR